MTSPSFFLRLLCLLPAAWATTAFAQETFPVNGVKEKDPKLFAFTNATIHPEPGVELKAATLVIKDGRIEALGKGAAIPKGAVVTDLKGAHIYPSFVDPYTSYGLAPARAAEKPAPGGPAPMVSTRKGAYHWNAAIMPEVNAYDLFSSDPKAAKEYRQLGFGTVLSLNPDGIARGSSVLVTLNQGRDNEVVLKEKAAAHYSFNKGTSPVDYPGSLMGSIALLRQTYLDAAWYKKQQPVKEVNLSLEAWNQLQSLPQIFEVKDKWSLLRADRVGDEAGVQYIIKGSGDEYQRIEDIKKTKAPLILSLDLPKAYDVEDPFDGLSVTLAQLKHWELAPTNLAAVSKAGIPFALTAYDLKDKSAFFKSLQTAIENGLTKDQALAALTVSPAKMLKAEDQVGRLKPGLLANFLITSEELFEKETVLHENWVRGQQFVLSPRPERDLRGYYALTIGNNRQYQLQLKGNAAKPQALVLGKDTTDKRATTFNFSNDLVSLYFSPTKDSTSSYIQLSGYWRPDGMQGRALLPNGNWTSWSAKFTKALSEKEKSPKDSTKQAKAAALQTANPGQVLYPFNAYGLPQLPNAEPVLIKNVTAWTNEKEGVVQGADVLLANGKIVAVGKNLNVAKLLGSKGSSVKTIDGTGKHLTPGIIDEHSHIAINGGVNEGTQAVTSEVRIGDVINPEDVNIYRQLAGGVTAIQQLHGSANPIGGQSSLTKLRWGRTAEEMKIEGAYGFIKFALGENVKQSNWGDNARVRFPQTRMGVEQAFYDSFVRAREYDAAWQKYNKLSGKERERTTAPRRDLELETLVEILHDKRFITCHSYVQSEINMLLHVADSMKFRVNTFTHILEGYKVADKMKKHGAAGSTFSDWWAYKFEVNDAIPYNGAILHEQGVLTAFNSDDAEMGRRLNQEAAKAVKYGKVSEEDALKFVTLNPAKILHLDKRMGSLKPSKDADVVLWSAHPLSIYAEAEKTFIDGICYYDKALDQQHLKNMAAERSRLVQKMLAYKKAGGETQKPKPEKSANHHCDDLGSNDEY